jgi:hypothetical protein
VALRCCSISSKWGAAARTRLARRPTAWETSIRSAKVSPPLTSCRIDYVNQVGELIGVNAVDPIGKNITDIITLLDEGDRRSLGDPVRHCPTTQSKVTSDGAA